MQVLKKLAQLSNVFLNKVVLFKVINLVLVLDEHGNSDLGTYPMVISCQIIIIIHNHITFLCFVMSFFVKTNTVNELETSKYKVTFFV